MDNGECLKYNKGRLILFIIGAFMILVPLSSAAYLRCSWEFWVIGTASAMIAGGVALIATVMATIEGEKND